MYGLERAKRMYAMQYEFNLPAEYDIGIIRRRVAMSGRVLDDFPGLGLKAYLVRDRPAGSTVNQYAPFYLWNDVEAMGRFLWGGGHFTKVCTALGRPSVRHWTGIDSRPGFDRDLPVVAATKHTESFPPDVDPGGTVAAAVEMLEKTAVSQGVHSTAVAVDPTSWELVHFTLWSGAVPAAVPGTRYQVLHLSTPGTEALFSR
jgi:hypothetical protein